MENETTPDASPGRCRGSRFTYLSAVHRARHIRLRKLEECRAPLRSRPVRAAGTHTSIALSTSVKREAHDVWHSTHHGLSCARAPRPWSTLFYDAQSSCGCRASGGASNSSGQIEIDPAPGRLTGTRKWPKELYLKTEIGLASPHQLFLSHISCQTTQHNDG